MGQKIAGMSCVLQISLADAMRSTSPAPKKEATEYDSMSGCCISASCGGCGV